MKITLSGYLVLAREADKEAHSVNIELVENTEDVEGIAGKYKEVIKKLKEEK